MSYYNTTNEKGEILKDAKTKTDKQDFKIIQFFRSEPKTPFTPFEIWINLFDNTTPLTSVRRSITNLEHNGKLIKTATKKEGGFGRSNYCWTAS